MSYVKCMNRNCRIPSLCTVCVCHCVAIDYFEVAWICIYIYIYLYIDAWFFQTLYAFPIIIPVQAQPATQMDYISSPKAWILIRIYGNFKPPIACCSYISGSFCPLLALLWPTVVQLLNVSRHIIGVWCVPCATCLS